MLRLLDKHYSQILTRTYVDAQGHGSSSWFTSSRGEPILHAHWPTR